MKLIIFVKIVIVCVNITDSLTDLYTHSSWYANFLHFLCCLFLSQCKQFKMCITVFNLFIFMLLDNVQCVKLMEKIFCYEFHFRRVLIKFGRYEIKWTD